ncbi:MAG: CvpA family protein [Candidatus Omnitrophica bacterium]|nr:CvpA family protein [Candidatus Omnitrophota bacterium]
MVYLVTNIRRIILPEVFQRINWVDALIVILLFRTSYIGARNGLSEEIFRIIGVLTGLFFSIKFYSLIGSRINSTISLPQEYVDGATFLILILLSMLSLKLVALGLTKIVKLTFSDQISKWGGFIVGLFRGAVLLSLLFMLFGIIRVDYLVKSVEERSLTGPYVAKIAPNVYQVVARTSPEIVKALP